jgi:YebC/PmpR family DNA-binding regulatory protein
MSGHSKWHSIKHKKGAIDAKRGKLFTKVIREMTIAARLGGGDVDSNPRLRTAVEKAKSVNMPADNIKRAIQKGTGELPGAQYEELSLEGYGPGGIAILVEGSTDNRNRTVSEIRHLFAKHGGNLGTANCVGYMFQARGHIVLAKEKATEDQLMELTLDAGAQDIQDSGDVWEIFTEMPALDAVVKALRNGGITPDESQIAKFPDTPMAVEDAKVNQTIKLIDGLEDNDDVQNVWTNAEISDEQLEAAG